MSGDFPFTAKIVSPVKCNEKPWDLWVSEIGHSSPRRDDDGGVFVAPADVEGKSSASRRAGDVLAHKGERARGRSRRAGLNRLSYDSMSLHGLFPQMDNLNAAVCHMCGVIVKCSAVYRHLLEFHSSVEPIKPPPPPAPTVKLKSSHSRSRHKKELAPPPPPIDILPMKLETSPIHTATTPLSRIVMPQPELQYLEEASTSTGLTGEVQVCVESGELPVVSIQDTDDLPLGENITDDIFAIMNSEGIQSADDITNSADWKNIIRDIGNMQDINFSQPTDPVQSQEVYPVDTAALSAFALSDTDLSSYQFPPNTSPMLPALEATTVNPPMKPTTVAPVAKSNSRAKTKSKFVMRQYDPNKHCGVVTVDNPNPCTRSLTCKAHALSLRRMVEGRAKAFDTLLAEHRASRDAAAQPPPQTPPPAPAPLPVLVDNTLDLAALDSLAADQQVNEIYASLLGVEESVAALPDPDCLSLLSQSLPETVPDEVDAIASPERKCPTLVPSDVCWYATCPRPLALCTFNASHAAGAVTLGKRFATVRSNIKSSLSRSQCKTGSGGGLALGRSGGPNRGRPEVRRLVVALGSAGSARPSLNGHVRRGKRPPSMLDLGFVLDPLLADEKC